MCVDPSCLGPPFESVAKYYMLLEAVKDTIHLRRMLQELQVFGTDPSLLLNGNQSCNKLVNNPIMQAHTKHIEIQFHFIREKNLGRDITVNYVPTS